MGRNEVERSLQSGGEPDGRAEAALLHLERVTDCLRREIYLTLRASGMTTGQYNVLRALHSESPNGLTCTELGNRLAGSDPDITRLLDRLSRQQLVRRRRDVRDRRAVVSEITEEGQRLLESVTPRLEARIQALFGHMAGDRLQLLIELLEELARGEPVRLVPQARAG